MTKKVNKPAQTLTVEKKEGVTFQIHGTIPMVVKETGASGPHVADVLRKLVVDPMAQGEGLNLPPGTYQLQMLIVIS